MWQAPNQRIRSLQDAQKRKQDRLRRPLHIKRVRAELKVLSHGPSQGQVSDARVILNDLSPQGMGLFSPSPILVGQELAITLQDPKRIYVHGRVIWCQEYEMEGHIISELPFSFRMGIKFLFKTPEEEQALKRFCEELFRDHLYGNAA